MFIELAEFIRCPRDHPETHCVLMPSEMIERSVIRGIVGCPECRREYPIEGGIARFGAPPPVLPVAQPPEPEVVQALLGLSTPGGYLVLVGSATRLSGALGRLIGGLGFVAVNADPALVEGLPSLSFLEAEGSIPLRSAMARGVVLGQEYAREPWTREAARVLLPGLRLVALRDELESVGLERLASGPGIWVGRKPGEAGKGKREG